MNGLLAEIEERRARRALSDKPIPKDVVERVLTAGTYAPSCFNNQPWRFIAVQAPESLDLVKQHLSKNNLWGTSSPLMVLVVTKPDLDCRLDGERDYALFDAGMAVMALQLQAVKEGLYVHPIAGFRAPELRTAMGIPEDHILITVVILGYPGTDELLNDKQKDSEKSARERKPLSDVVANDKWTFSA
jgi:nitroreductase